MNDCDIFEIWEEYKSSLLAYIRKRVTDKDDSKDILQEVLLKSYHYCTKGKAVTHLKSWLYKITQNAVTDYFKRSNKRSHIDIDLAEDNDKGSIWGEASDYVRVLLKLLPPDYAVPLSMSDIDGIDQKLIAKKLHLSLPNTKSRIQRARVKLKERFLECVEVTFAENGEMTAFDIKPQCKELQVEKAKLENNS